MIKLTDEQKKVMLQLGKKNSTVEAVPKPVVDELIRLGLLRYNINFTDEGERIYETLLHRRKFSA
jgi:hypothetical protein